MSIYDLADAFAAMTLNLTAHCFVELLFLPHSCERMAGIIGQVLSDLALFVFILEYSYIVEQGIEETIYVCAVVGVKIESVAA